MLNYDKIKETKSVLSASAIHSNTGKPSFQLKDNRAKSIKQKKLVASMAEKNSYQKKENNTGLLQMSGKVNINDNKEFEKEADVMGAKAKETHRLHLNTQQRDKELEKEADTMGAKTITKNKPVLLKQNIALSPVVQRKILLGDKELTLQDVKLWLLKAHYSFDSLMKYTPEIINDIQSADPKIVTENGQKQYLDSIRQRKFDEGKSVFLLDDSLRSEDKNKKKAFEELFDLEKLDIQYISHWWGVKKRSPGNNGNRFDDEALELYKRIQRHLLNPDLVFTVLNKLDNFIGLVGPSKLPGKDWHKELLGGLSGSGILQEPKVIDKLLDPDEFLDETTGKGILPLDTGADFEYYKKPKKERTTSPQAGLKPLPKHGALSHTIQWLIIQEGIKNAPETKVLIDIFKDSSKFRKSNKEIDEEINDKTPSLWSAIVDLPPIHGIKANATFPEGVTTFIDKFFPNIKAVEDAIESEYLQLLANKGETVYNSGGGIVKSATAAVKNPRLAALGGKK